MTASSSGCTPLFLNEEPHSTGRELEIERGLADRRAQEVDRDLGLLEDQLEQLVVVVRDLLEQVLAGGLGHVAMCSGMSLTSTSLPSSSL